MAIETDADRLVFLEDFDLACFGSRYINGIFYNEYISAGSEIGIESTSPAFTCRTIDVTDIVHGDELVVNDVCYTVRGVQPDGTGMTAIILESV